MDGREGHYLFRNKAGTERHIPSILVCENLTVDLTEEENRRMVTTA
jgi:hypothetical protein